MLFNVDIVTFSQNTMEGDTEHLVLFSWFGVFWFSRWVVAAWCRKCYLGWAKISSVVYLVKLKDRGSRMSFLYCVG